MPALTLGHVFEDGKKIKEIMQSAFFHAISQINAVISRLKS